MSDLANLATDLAKACQCASEPCVAMLRGHGGHCCLTAGEPIACHRDEWLTIHLAACPDPHPAVRGASCMT